MYHRINREKSEEYLKEGEPGGNRSTGYGGVRDSKHRGGIYKPQKREVLK